jgi:glucuronoarabinoxylan endo-1,4-beta-xylanase
MKPGQCIKRPEVYASLRSSQPIRRTALERSLAARWQLLVLVCGCVALSCSDDSPNDAPALFAGSGGASPPYSQAGGAGTASSAGTSNGGTAGGTDVGNGAAAGGAGAPDVADAGDAGVIEPDAGPVVCNIIPNGGSLTDGDANVDLGVELQRISGFGGMDGGFYAELTAGQVDTAFGNGPGQLGLSIIRIRVPEAQANFNRSLPAAARATQLGATVLATPWTPPANLKSNNDTTGGSLNVASYGAYADHLLAFRDFMQSNGAPLYAISVQNEPDIQVTYESCDWTATQLIDWISSQGSKFGDTRLVAPESFNFNRQLSDPILNDPEASAQVDIVAGHVYGGGLADYPLARQKGKEVWMTEHYTDSASSANAWPLALDVGTEINNAMRANFSAYIWWAIRRAYGLITEDGAVSKRGYLMAQYSKFIRPGYVRVSASQPNNANVAVTAYKGEDKLVVVAVNRSAQPQAINLDVFNSCATGFARFTTSVSKNVADDGAVALTNGRVGVTLDGQSVTTFVSQ